MASTGGIPSSHGSLVLSGESTMDVDAVLRRPDLSTPHVGSQSFLNNVISHHGGTDITYLTSDTSGDVTACITGSDTQRASASGLYQPSTSLETQSRSQTEHIGINPDVIQTSESLRFEYSLDEAATPTKTKSKKTPPTVYREQDRFVPINNTGRVMRNAVPKNAKISKDAKQCMQECVSEFISFLTSEASDRCIDEKRKTITGDDILYSLSTLGFDSYVDPLHMYLKKYREFIHYDKPGKESDADGCHDNEEDDQSSLSVQHAMSTTQLQGTSAASTGMDHEAALHMLTGQLPSNSILPNP